jgi:hypothetical protein
MNSPISATVSANCGLYYKHVTIVNDNSSIINKRSFKLIDDARVIIYDRNRFIIRATGQNIQQLYFSLFVFYDQFMLHRTALKTIANCPISTTLFVLLFVADFSLTAGRNLQHSKYWKYTDKPYHDLLPTLI